MALTKTRSLDAFIKKKGTSFVVTANNIRVLVPKIYAERKLMTIEDTVTTLGIFKVIINNRLTINLMMTSMLELQPSSTDKYVEDDYEYVALDFVKGDAFIMNSTLIKDSSVIYNVFVTFIKLGKIPPFLDYRSIMFLFDKSDKLNGLRFDINHSTYEVVFAHMYRDSKDPFLAYRYTKMKEQPTVVSLNKISHGPSSASARAIGSYMNDGIISNLVHDNEKPSAIENLLRA